MSTRQTITRRSLEWLRSTSAEAASRRHGCPLLDIRPTEQARANHLPASAQLAVAGEFPKEGELPSHMLGPSGTPLAVFAANPELALNCAMQLQERGWNAEFVDGFPDEEVLKPGPATGALWTPDPFLAAQVDRLPPPDAGPVVDLGAGNGRDAVFMAQRGHDVLMVDRLPDALELAQDRARRHGVRCRNEVADLRYPDRWDGGGFAAALCVRFVSRELLRGLHERMLPGSILIYSGFGLTEFGEGARQNRLSLEEAHELISAEQWQWLVEPRRSEQNHEHWLHFVARRRSD